MKQELTYERLKQMFSYSPETGEFTRLVRTSNSTRVGEVAGGKMTHGYLTLCIDYQSHYAHRLAWLYTHGVWPDRNIDHINGNRLDNRIANIRQCNQTENLFNAAIRKNNTSGYRGVYWNKRKQKFEVKCNVNKQTTHLGYFGTIEAAAIAYRSFAESQHGEFFFETSRGHKTGKVSAL